MRIILAVDDSPATDAAVDEVASRTWPKATTVRILSALDRFVPPAVTLWYDAGGNVETARNQVKGNFAEQIKPIAERLRANGLGVEEVIRDGDPRKVIVAESKSWPADLIVVGLNRHSAVRKLLVGSVAHAVVSHAPCPVEVIPGKDSPGGETL